MAMQCEQAVGPANWSNDGLVLQLAGSSPTVEVTEKTARKIGDVLGLRPGVLNQGAGGSPLTAARACSGQPDKNRAGAVVRLLKD